MCGGAACRPRRGDHQGCGKKKLIEVAEHLGRRRLGEEDIQKELDVLTRSGMPKAVIDHRRELLGGGDCFIWEENVVALQLFLRCQPLAIQTIKPAGLSVVSGIQWLGITAAELEAALRISGQPRKSWPALADDVMAMSAAWTRQRNAPGPTAGIPRDQPDAERGARPPPPRR